MRPLLALALLLALPAAGTAGDEPTALLGVGDRVRVLAAGGGPPFAARVVEVGPDGLTVRTRLKDPPRIVPLGDVLSLERSLGWRSHARRGALIGFMAGFALGAKVGSELSCLDESKPCPRAGPALRGGALTGAVTAGLGALIGLALAHERWQSMPLPPGRATVRLEPSLAPVPRGIAAGFTLRF